MEVENHLDQPPIFALVLIGDQRNRLTHAPRSPQTISGTSETFAWVSHTNISSNSFHEAIQIILIRDLTGGVDFVG
jgi:hypothetical protein